MNYLRIEKLTEKLSIKRNTVYKFMLDGILPRPIKLGKVSLWIEEEVDEAMAELAKKRPLE